MIQEGLYAKVTQAPSVQALLPTDPANGGASLAYQAVHFGRAPQQPARPFIVVHLVNAPPAEASLDGVSELIDGDIQFDSYADDALTARQVSRAVRDLFKNFAGSLSDGTFIQFVDVTADFDDTYQVGGVGYLFRSVIRLKALYTEGPNNQ
jgi:hypothetical protein